MIMDIASYEDSLRGGLNPEDEIKTEIEEMKKAKIGDIKPNCWEKLTETDFDIYNM